jgi:D-amino-acid oxidase
MHQSVAIIGAGVAGLTSGVILAERGYPTAIFAEETGQRTTSAAAAAIWYPYDAAPVDKVIFWALQSYPVLTALAADAVTGVSMIELRTFARTGKIHIPEWAIPLGAQHLSYSEIQQGGEERFSSQLSRLPAGFTSGFTLEVPLMDTTIYLDYLAGRFIAAGGDIKPNVRLAKPQHITADFELIVNCAGMGAKALANDFDLEPHRGQVVIVPKLGISSAIVSDDVPLMYAIPRGNDCVFGGTNDLSDDRTVDPLATSHILAECARVLDIDLPTVLGERVGIRPFRRSGVRVSKDLLPDGRTIIHNYGHGGSGFTLSWGCARDVLSLTESVIGQLESKHRTPNARYRTSN